jgi:hypothetical protein
MSPLNVPLAPWRVPLLLSAALLALSPAMPASVQAQDRMHAVSDGHGGVEGAPVRPVQSLELHPGQVQAINLHPRFHMIVEFPYQVARIDAGDPDVFLAEVMGNKVALKATRVTRSETSMSVVLADAEMTVVPFLVRADSTQPIVYVLRYTDPVAKHLNAQESQIAARVKADNERRVDALTEDRLRQRMLLSSDVVRIDKQAAAGRAGERIILTIENAQEIPNERGAAQLYVRYQLLNQTSMPLSDLTFGARIATQQRKWGVMSRTSERALYDVHDERSAIEVPAGTLVSGILILDALDLQPNESLSIEASAFNGQRTVRLDRVLVGG